MTTTAPTGIDRPVVELIPVAMIDPSPTNPRKMFVQAELDELAASLTTVGQLENILVRPSPTKPKRFELVFGERRWRAAKIAKLPELLSAVKELTDVQTLEVQLIENAKRKDLHPIEEAETYEALHKKHGFSVDDIAAKVGTSKGAVYARLKLCALGPDARKLFLEGKLSPSTALYVARIPVPELQKQAATEIANTKGEPLNARDAAEHVRTKYMLRLADAPFDKGDAELVDGAGPCTTCPKRTGNQKELFDDVKSGDVCTDPVCFGKKRDAVRQQKTAAAKAEGTKVLSDTESKKLFPYGNDYITGGDYVDVKSECHKDPKGRPWKAVLGKHAPDVVLARDPAGNVRELVPVGAATAALKKAGHSWAKPEPKPAKKAKAAPGLEELEAQILSDRLFEAAGKKDVGEATLLRLVVKYFTADTYGYDGVATRRGLVSKQGKSKGVGAQMNSLDAAARALNTVAGKAKAPELRRLVVELLVAHAIDNSGMAEGSKLFPQILDALNLDRKAIAAEAKKKLEASKKPAEPVVVKVTKGPAKKVAKPKSKPKPKSKKTGSAK